MNNQTNTTQGTNVEHLFANSIQDHPKTFNLMLKAVGIPKNTKPTEYEVVGGSKRKADVEISFNTKPPIRVNIKSFKGAGYNHVERRGFLTFCERNQISKSDTEFLKKLWLRKAASSRRELVEYCERERVIKIFSTIEPANSALLGNDHPQFLALYSMDRSLWRIYHMTTQVMPLLRANSVSFTSRSSNIEIGNYIVIQRKGSSKGESGTDPLHISHGSNNVQVKMRVRRFFEDVEPIAWYQF